MSAFVLYSCFFKTLLDFLILFREKNLLDFSGYAELLMEQEMDPGSLQGQSKFVAAFAQSNEGDVSPNTKGPHCIDTGNY